MSKKQRNRNRATALALHYSLPPTRQCPNCKELTHQGHFCPPWFGDNGGYFCEKK